MIISLGYRIKSKITTNFRRWATERLKGNGGDNYWKELLVKIKDVRLSETVLYRQTLVIAVEL